jgi:hypothetical protein
VPQAEQMICSLGDAYFVPQWVQIMLPSLSCSKSFAPQAAQVIGLSSVMDGIFPLESIRT